MNNYCITFSVRVKAKTEEQAFMSVWNKVIDQFDDPELVMIEEFEEADINAKEVERTYYVDKNELKHLPKEFQYLLDNVFEDD